MGKVYNISTGRKAEDDSDKMPEHKGEYLFQSMLESNDYLKNISDPQAVFNTSALSLGGLKAVSDE